MSKQDLQENSFQEILDSRYHKENRAILRDSINKYWSARIIFLEEEEDDW